MVSSEEILTSLVVPLKRFAKPPLVVVFGLPYTGQTEISRYLSEKYELLFLSTDWLRIRFGFSSGPETHQQMFKLAKELLGQGVGIVWDGIHLSKLDRDVMRSFAKENNAKLVLINTAAPQELIDVRLEERCADPEKATQEGKYCVTKEHFAQIATFLEKPSEEEEVITIPTLDDNQENNISPFKSRIDFLLKQHG